ncbi:MAG: TonB-dependent receptor [Flavobacteriales bacterium]|nr:TonB-dependent receptor [Flavobacteriales bacterium]
MNAQSQNNFQNIKGQVSDKQSKEYLIGASVVIIGFETRFAAITDGDGKFKISDVPAGRYDLKIRYIGYKEIILYNIQVTSGKEVSLEIDLEENINSLKEVSVTATKKNETINEMTSVSARSFSTEEVNRYAGGRADPSRLAANFAGVSTPDDSRNDLVIRGNSPTGVLWRIEGLNIPNPNHFSTIGTTGGPVSSLNTNVLNNSDFFTSAFPSEYGNANAGVFDLSFRKGNSDKREHTLQFGALTGLEAMTEGPINRKKGSSYLIAYRYSFTGFAQSLGLSIGTTATPFYQDLAFKVNGARTKFGTFTFFGLAGTSKITFDHNEVDTTDLFADPTRDSYFTSKMGLGGISHFIRAGKRSYFKTVLGATYSASEYDEDTISVLTNTASRALENKVTQIRYILNTSYNSKINSRLFLKFGFIEELIHLNLFYRHLYNSPTWRQFWDFDDYTSLLQAYAHAKISLNSRLVLNAGLHSQFLTLNKSFAIEPRLGLKYKVNSKSTFSAGYGMHSQMQPTDVYFYRTQLSDGSYESTNESLDFTRSHHFVLGYDLLPWNDWRIKAEVYYQMLNNVPVSVDPSSFSMLNNGASFAPNEESYLTNSGTGTNYGIEFTLEKFFSKGYYGLITATLYESKYKGSDNVERNTAFNGKYVYNILVGKEYKFGKTKRHRFNIDAKLTSAGGRHYTPVDLAASQIKGQEVLLGDAYAFSERNPAFFRFDLKLGATINSSKRKLAHTIFFDIQNVTNTKNVFAQRYNPITNKINTAYQIGLFPNFVYKIQF